MDAVRRDLFPRMELASGFSRRAKSRARQKGHGTAGGLRQTPGTEFADLRRDGVQRGARRHEWNAKAASAEMAEAHVGPAWFVPCLSWTPASYTGKNVTKKNGSRRFVRRGNGPMKSGCMRMRPVRWRNGCRARDRAGHGRVRHGRDFYVRRHRGFLMLSKRPTGEKISVADDYGAPVEAAQVGILRL